MPVSLRDLQMSLSQLTSVPMESSFDGTVDPVTLSPPDSFETVVGTINNFSTIMENPVRTVQFQIQSGLCAKWKMSISKTMNWSIPFHQPKYKIEIKGLGRAPWEFYIGATTNIPKTALVKEKFGPVLVKAGEKYPSCSFELHKTDELPSNVYLDGNLCVRIQVSMWNTERLVQADSWVANLYKFGKYSDVTIKCCDEVFRAHKIILCQSPVFAKMFETPMREAASSVVEIADIDPMIVEIMIRSMYDTRVELPKSKEALVAVVSCADQYGLAMLKKQVFEEMYRVLSLENAPEFALAAWKYTSNARLQNHFLIYCYNHHLQLAQNENYKKLYVENWEAFTQLRPI